MGGRAANGRRVTAAEVARRAGVSRATVSYVLNDDPVQSFTDETRARVRAAAVELGYVPNQAARALRVGRTTTVLLPLPGIYLSPVWAGIVDAASRALAAKGATLVADFTRYDSPEALVDAGLRLQPAVVIDTMAVDREVFSLFEAHGAYVLTSRPVLAADPVTEPGRRARTMQVDHLIARGCRGIASVVVADSPDSSRQGTDVDAVLGAQCRAAGVRLETFALEPGSATSARALVAKLAARSERRRIDGAAVVNDHLAVALSSACIAAGMRVPDDLAIIGLDDHPLAAVVTPSLTTIAWDMEAFAGSLAGAVESALAGGHPTLGLEDVTWRVLERESA